ncbi:TRAP transporter large permease [Roseomonas sp. AR75]|uniref:TRAP transporter large permease n=1 Tax=Roseomonas sp. AR75 TaxID=2562311 RepID=UPI0010C143DC|nr:TRAP transporter large permease [Roseomonas sp. AR75]
MEAEAAIVLAVFLGGLVLALATGAPVAVGMGLIGAIGVAFFVSVPAVAQIANLAFAESASFILVVVPLFVLMGEVLARSGMGEVLFRAARVWLRGLPAASAVSTIGACAIFSSVCGSSPVTAATIGSFAVPEMVRQGYRRSFALGATAAGGTLGILIPPSVPMILYGVLTESSIAELFAAGLLPGLMMAALLAATAMLVAHFDRGAAPREVIEIKPGERGRSLRDLVPVLLLVGGVIGSIYAGVATPTEAAAVGAAGAMLLALSWRRLTLEVFGASLDRTVRTTAMFLLLLVSGLFATFMLSRLGVPQAVAEALSGLPLPPWAVLAAIVATLVVLGCFLDPMSILVIMVPILFPTVVALGYDPIWFGIIVTITIEIAAITPPVGFNLFVLRAAVPGASVVEAARGSLVFVLPMLMGVVILFLFPGIALLLPGMMR